MNASRTKWTAPPSPKEITDFLERLLDRKVTVAAAPWPTFAGAPASFVGLYVNPEDGVEAALVLQPPVAAALGAALSLVPPRSPSVQSALKSDEWEPMLVENIAEVANIMLRLVQMAGCPAVTLAGLSRGQPKDVKVAPGVEQGGRAGYRVEVEGYGAGVMGLARAWRG